MIAYRGGGEGIIVLTNGSLGRRLMDVVVRAVATDYGWTDVAAPATEVRSLSDGELAKIAGRFEIGGLVKWGSSSISGDLPARQTLRAQSHRSSERREPHNRVADGVGQRVPLPETPRTVSSV